MTVSNITFSPTVISSGRWSSSAQGGSGGGGTLIARADWGVHSTTPTDLSGYEATTGWLVWGDNLTQNTNFLRGVYPSTIGGSYNQGLTLSLDDSLAIADVYIEMQVRYALAAPAKQGLKFLKFFGAVISVTGLILLAVLLITYED